MSFGGSDAAATVSLRLQISAAAGSTRKKDQPPAGLWMRAHVVSQRLVDRGDAGWALEFTPLRLSRTALRTLLSPGTLRDGSLIPRIGEA